MAVERDDALPPVTVTKLAPRCRCGSTSDLIVGDGPVVCRVCIWEAGVMARATVRRSDTPDVKERDHRDREGYWPA